MYARAFGRATHDVKSELKAAISDGLSFAEDQAVAEGGDLFVSDLVLEPYSKSAFSLAGSMSDEIRSRGKQLIQEALAGPNLDVGSLIEQISALVDDRFSDARLETIARTEFSKAYNAGRNDLMLRSSVTVALQYSAVLDGRTTEYCRAWDGVVVGIDERDVIQRNGPPAHPNCRSMWVPITSYDACPSSIGMSEDASTLSSDNPLHLGIMDVDAPIDEAAQQAALKALKKAKGAPSMGGKQKTIAQVKADLKLAGYTASEAKTYIAAMVEGEANWPTWGKAVPGGKAGKKKTLAEIKKGFKAEGYSDATTKQLIEMIKTGEYEWPVWGGSGDACIKVTPKEARPDLFPPAGFGGTKAKAKAEAADKVKAKIKGRAKTPKEWFKRLTTKQADAFEKWTEDFYEEIKMFERNDKRGMRKAWAGSAAKVWAEAKKQAAAISEALDFAPHHVGRVYRGGMLTDEQFKAITKSGKLKIDSLTSFSKKQRVARDFLESKMWSRGQQPVILEVLTKDGGVAHAIDEISVHPEEAEVVMRRGGRLKLVEVKDGDEWRGTKTRVKRLVFEEAA